MDKASISVALVQGAVEENIGWPYGKYTLGGEVNYNPKKLLKNSSIAWAGVRNSDNKMTIIDGRVAHVIAIGTNVKSLQKEVYQSIDAVNFNGKKFRKDIGGRNKLSNTEAE